MEATANPTIINHGPCGVCEAISPPDGAVFHTAIPDRNVFITTYVARARGGMSASAETCVLWLDEERCEHCHTEHYTGRGDRIPLHVRKFDPDRVSESGLLEAHEFTVAQFLTNKLP